VSVTPGPMDHAQLRVVIAEDAVLLREGLRRVLTDAGLDVAGTAGDADLGFRKIRATVAPAPYDAYAATEYRRH